MNDSMIESCGIKVLYIIPNSPSEKAGVQVGDIILAVDGVAIKTLDEYADCVSNRKGYMHLDILRGNSYLEIDVPPSEID